MDCGNSMAPNIICTWEEKEDVINDDRALLEYQLSIANALQRVSMVVDHFGPEHVTLLTSFGVQSGVMLSLGMFL